MPTSKIKQDMRIRVMGAIAPACLGSWCDLHGINQGAFYGKDGLTAYNLEKIADAVPCTVDWLLGRDEPVEAPYGSDGRYHCKCGERIVRLGNFCPNCGKPIKGVRK